jgi:hypothetical protein
LHYINGSSFQTNSLKNSFQDHGHPGIYKDLCTLLKDWFMYMVTKGYGTGSESSSLINNSFSAIYKRN